MKVHELFEDKPPYKEKIPTDGDYATLINKLNAECSDAIAMLKNDSFIFRASQNDNDIEALDVDYSKGERSSRNTGNGYTLIIDNSPHFAGWPKRSKSIICSNSVDYVEHYNYDTDFIDVVIPKNGTKIAVCPKKDIWFTPLPGNKLFDDFSQYFGYGDIGDLSDLAGVLNSDFDIDSNVTDFKKFEKLIANVIASEKKDKDNVVPKSFDNIVETLLKIVTPKKLGFELLSVKEFATKFKGSYGKFLGNENGSNECWIGGPCIFIKYPTFLKIREAYKRGEF